MPAIRLMKVSITRYYDARGKNVPKGTPGARKVLEKSARWYAEWREHGKKRKKPLATDKQVAQKMLSDLILAMEKGTANPVDPYAVHRERPISEHVADYLSSLEGKDVSAKHYAEKSRCLNAVIEGCQVKTLPDLTADRLDKFLARMTCSARTRDTYRMSALTFANWLVKQDRLDRNPLDKSQIPRGNAVRVRRSLTPPELQLLLDTARVRPLNEFSTIRRGEREGERVANLRPEVRERLTMLGRERALIYKMAVYTGLRRGEISALKVADLSLDAKPYPTLTLPGSDTKNGDDAKLLLLPTFAEELRAWVKDARKLPTDNLFSVRLEMVKNLKADLKASGIPFEDARGRVADFHSLRMSANMMLGQAGVPPRIRQLFMRHSDIRLTMETYDDTTAKELEQTVKAMEGYGLR
jgi:integrase